jgi:hypothetical protein
MQAGQNMSKFISPLSWIIPNCARLRRQDGGSFAIIFGFVLVVLAGSIGMYIDYNRAASLKTRLQAAADMAVLSTLVSDDKIDDSKTRAEAFLRATLGADDNKHITSVNAVVANAGGEKRLTIHFTATIPSTILGVLGYQAIDVGGAASAKIGIPKPLRLHFLLDASGSMALPSVPADRLTLKAATAGQPRNPNCEFACHTPQAGPAYLQIARDANLTLRLDSARTGIKRFIALAEGSKKPGQIYEYELSAFTSATSEVAAATQNTSLFISKMDAIDIGFDGDEGNTFYDIAFPQAVNNYNSTKVDNTEEIVVLITDGLRSIVIDSTNKAEANKNTYAITLALCDQLKADGRKLAVIYTPYYPVLDSPAYFWLVAPRMGVMNANMKACASDGLFAQGVDNDDIVKAFEQLFDMISKRKNIYLDS